MYCPGCGMQTALEQKFCRACGINLEPISKALAAEMGEDSCVESNRHLMRRMTRLMRWGIIVMFIGMFIGIIGKKIAHEEIVATAGAIMALGGIFLICYSALPAFAMAANKKARASLPPKAQTQTTKPLPLQLPPAHVPSIAERTTELLEIEELRTAERKQT